MIAGLSPEELRDLIVSVGTHQGARRLSPLEVSDRFAKARSAGATLGECAAAVGFASSSMVTRFLRLQELSEPVREMVDWGASSTSLPFTAGAEIARLPAPAREPLARAALAASLSAAEVTQVVQRLLRSDEPVQGAVAEILRLRPQVERRHVFVGRFADRQLAQRAGRLDVHARAELASAVLHALLDGIRADMRVTSTGFVLVVEDERDAAHVSALPDFEAAIAEAIAEQLRLQ